MGELTFLQAGYYSSIQDLGRFGYRHLGVPLSGAMDHYHASLANLLVNNLSSSPVIEITLIGPEIQFSKETLISITGAHLSPTLENVPISLNSKITIQAGQILRFGKLTRGCRAYLAVHGLEGDTILGSRSQYAGITSSAKINTNDRFTYESIPRLAVTGSKIKVLKHFFDSKELDVYPGPEFENLKKKNRKLLLSSPWTVNENNRMGYQLKSDVDLKNEHSMITSNVVPGTVQLTPSGKLLVLMRDGQVTGGYPRILQLSENSINRLAQKRTGTALSFNLIEYQS